MARIVVIGAGLGGMAVAARLAVKRHDVTLVEAAHQPGGQVRAIERHGCVFELGPTALTLPAVYRDLFLKTGSPLEDELDLIPLEPVRHYHFADGTHLELPGAGVGATVQAVGSAFGTASAAQWGDLMAHAGRVWARTRTGLTTAPPPPGSARDRPPSTAGRRRARTLHDLARALTDPRARAVLADSALPLPVDPHTAPAESALGAYLTATFGAWHVRGGMHRLSLALHTRMAQRGVTVLLGHRAQRIELEGDAGRVAAVLVAEPGGTTRRLPAEVVIADLPTKAAVAALLPAIAALVPPRSRRAVAPSAAGRHVAGATRFLTRAHAAPPSARLTLLLTVRTAFPLGAGWEHVWLPADPRRPRPGRPALLDPDATLRLHLPDDPDMHPSGVGAWTVCVDAPPHSPGGRVPGTMDWDATGVADEHADHVLDRLAGLGVELAGRVAHREVRTPADHERATGMPGGALLGQSPTDVMTHDALTTPGNVTAIPGLFLVGAGTHPGPGLAMVGLSAELVAGIVGRA